MVDTHRRRVIATISTGALLGTTTAAGANTSQNETENENESEGESEKQSQQEEQPNGVQINHFSTDSPALQVTIDGPSGTVIDQPIEPFVDMDGYAPYEPGTHTITVTNPESGDRILTSEADLTGGPRMVSLIGESCSTSDRPLQAGVFAGDHSPTSEGMARIRGVHAIPDAGAIDFVRSGQTIINGIKFGESTYAEIEATDEPIEIYPDDGDEPVAKFKMDPAEGGVYSGVAVGYMNPENAPEDTHPKTKKVVLGVLVDKEPTTE